MANRILVYGVTGSGKTTLAAQIAERTGLPWHSVDDLTWQPGWIEVPPAEQHRRIESICAGDQWILDGVQPMDRTSACPSGADSRARLFALGVAGAASAAKRATGRPEGAGVQWERGNRCQAAGV